MGGTDSLGALRQAGVLGAAAVLTTGLIGFATLGPGAGESGGASGSGPGAGGSSATPLVDDQLVSFSSCSALAEFYRDQLSGNVGAYGLDYSPEDRWAWLPWRSNRSNVDAAGTAMPAAAEARSAPVTGDAVGPGTTGTNTQEAGVDEADTLKTNGTLMVTVEQGRLVVADVRGATPVVRGRLALPKTAPTGGPILEMGSGDEAQIILDRTRVLVMRTTSATKPGTDLVLVDISSPDSPKLVWHKRISGQYLAARLTHDRVRLVSQTPLALPLHTPSDHGESTGKAADYNRNLVRTATGEQYLPQVETLNAAGSVTASEPLVSCTQVAQPKDAKGVGMMTISTLDLSQGNPLVSSTSLAGDGHTVYASEDRLYVAAMVAPDTVVPRSGVASISVPRVGSGKTSLHSFDITTPNGAKHVASGSVEGSVHNQWAMDFSDGLFRIATTRWGTKGACANPSATGTTDSGPATSSSRVTPDAATPVSESVVTVFEEKGTKLTQVGSVGGLGCTETIRSVRWFEDYALVVTFRQTDPLYVVDLRSPRRPVVAGELKIPGYSAYLHPLGGDMILGLGQDATVQGQLLGTQVSTFDVSDPANPRQLHVLSEDSTNSEIEWDARGFTYLPNRRLAVVTINDVNSGTSSVRAVKVGEDGKLAQVGSHQPGTAGEGGTLTEPSYGRERTVRRVMAVSDDAVVALVNDRAGRGGLVRLGLDGLDASSVVPLV